MTYTDTRVPHAFPVSERNSSWKVRPVYQGKELQYRGQQEKKPAPQRTDK